MYEKPRFTDVETEARSPHSTPPTKLGYELHHWSLLSGLWEVLRVRLS